MAPQSATAQRRIGGLARSLLFRALGGNGMGFCIAQRLAVKKGLAVFYSHSADADIRFAHGVERIGGGDTQNVLEGYFNGQPKFVIGIEVELPRRVEIGWRHIVPMHIDTRRIGHITARRVRG